jgi:hypothetical protein
MQFTPKTASEIALMRLKPEGAYAFEVANAHDSQSKSSGKDMIVLDLNFYDANGSIFALRDYLVGGSQFGDKKIFEACRACGLSAKYESGKIEAEDFLGRSGWAKVKQGKAQEMKDKVTGQPTGKFFDPKNEVAYYLEGEPKAKTASNQPTEDQLANLSTPTTGSSGGKPTHSPAGPADDGQDIPFAPVL